MPQSIQNSFVYRKSIKPKWKRTTKNKEKSRITKKTTKSFPCVRSNSREGYCPDAFFVFLHIKHLLYSIFITYFAHKKRPNHQTTKPLNDQTTKPPNHQNPWTSTLSPATNHFVHSYATTGCWQHNAQPQAHSKYSPTEQQACTSICRKP